MHGGFLFPDPGWDLLSLFHVWRRFLEAFIPVNLWFREDIYLFEDKIILIYMYHRNVKHRCYTICGSAICLQTRNQLYRHLEEVTWQMKKCYLLLKVTALFSALKYERLIYKRICCVTNIYFIEHFPHKNTFNTSIQTTYQE